ncbi:uncharacterized protein LTR77_007638 [Saxophila tyrrhenica]|uniref:Uncharacterized protein n=1 Tax=Saxophila tyrrhenica TaxID=1690608 RepID=A0AAV9P2L7_9PEZI|nr:hypothetical protein LTR77_007638 [Saxophila tyrrhenica]
MSKNSMNTKPTKGDYKEPFGFEKSRVSRQIQNKELIAEKTREALMAIDAMQGTLDIGSSKSSPAPASESPVQSYKPDPKTIPGHSVSNNNIRAKTENSRSTDHSTTVSESLYPSISSRSSSDQGSDIRIGQGAREWSEAYRQRWNDEPFQGSESSYDDSIYDESLDDVDSAEIRLRERAKALSLAKKKMPKPAEVVRDVGPSNPTPDKPVVVAKGLGQILREDEEARAWRV